MDAFVQSVLPGFWPSTVQSESLCLEPEEVVCPKAEDVLSYSRLFLLDSESAGTKYPEVDDHLIEGCDNCLDIFFTPLQSGKTSSL